MHSLNFSPKKRVAIVVASVLQVKFFLEQHLKVLSKYFDVTLVVNNDHPKILEAMVLPVRVLTIPIERKISLQKDIQALFELIKIFSKEDFDLVHTMNPKAGLLGMLAAAVACVPIRIHTFQGEVWARMTGIKRQLFIFIDRLIASLATNLLVVSATEKDFLIESRIISPKKSLVLANGSIGGVDLQKFSPSTELRKSIRHELSIPDETVLLLYMGRLTREKGIYELGRVFERLNQDLPQPMVLLLVGPDEDNIRAYFAANFPSQEAQFKFIDYTSSPQKYLAAADILVLPSHREGFGVVIIEAAAMGVPTVATDIYGIQDAIENNITGLLFQLGSQQDLYAKLKLLILDDKLRRVMGVNARNRVIKSFNQQHVLQEFLDFYRTLLEKRSLPSRDFLNKFLRYICKIEDVGSSQKTVEVAPKAPVLIPKELTKICFVVSSPFTINSFLINHLKKLAEQYQITVCVHLKQYELSPNLNLSNLIIMDVPLERKISVLKDLKAWWVLFKIFRSKKFKSVHSITPKAGLLAMTAAFFAGIPNRFHTYTGQIWVTQQGLGRLILKRADWLIAKFSTLVFSDSSSQAQFLIDEKICQHNEISTLGKGSISGVDLDRFHPDESVRSQLHQKFFVNPKTCVFLFVGRLCRDKGIFDLVAAFSRVDSERQNVALWVVGPDEEQICIQIQALYPELYSRIRWFDFTFSPEIYMAGADVLLLPSYREGFGTVIIEAAACGLPVIAYRIYGVIDAVVEGETGFLVDVGNIEELSEKMQLFSNNFELRTRMGKLAREHSSRVFSDNVITQAWVDMYANNL